MGGVYCNSASIFAHSIYLNVFISACFRSHIECKFLIISVAVWNATYNKKGVSTCTERVTKMRFKYRSLLFAVNKWSFFRLWVSIHLLYVYKMAKTVKIGCRGWGPTIVVILQWIMFSEYFERILQLFSSVWICSVTGKSSLTYDEALESEKEALVI